MTRWRKTESLERSSKPPLSDRPSHPLRGPALSRILLSSLALLQLASWSCARRPLPVHPRVPIPQPQAQELVERLRSEAASVARYQGIVRIYGRGPEGSFDAKLVVIFRRPDAFRVELLGPLGRTQWEAVSDGRSITVWFPRRHQFVEEDEVEEVVGRLLGIRMTSAEVMDMLSGNGLDLSGDTVSSGYQEGPLTHLLLSDSRWIELSEKGQVARAACARYRVSYPNPWKQRQRHFPRRLEIVNERLKATLTTDGVDVNLPLHEEAFVLDVPSDAERLRLGQVGEEAIFVPAKKPGEK